MAIQAPTAPAGPHPYRPFSSAGRGAFVIPELSKTRVLVAHANEVLAAGISAILSAESEFDLVAMGSWQRSRQVPEQARQADVVITDYETALESSTGLSRSAAVLVIASSDAELHVRQALEAGVRGFLLNGCSAEELVEAVRSIKRGGTTLSASVASKIAESLAHEALTVRELDVLRIMMQGFSNKLIAKELDVSLGTVKTHVKSIFSKLNAGSRTQAAAIAQRRGIAQHPALL